MTLNLKMSTKDIYKHPCFCLVLSLICLLGHELVSSNSSVLAAKNNKGNRLKNISLLYISKKYEAPPPLSLVDKIIEDKGLQGAQMSNSDNNKAARFVGLNFELKVLLVETQEDIRTALKQYLLSGHKLIIADLKEEDLLKVADMREAKDALIFNVYSSSDRLRGKDCRINLYHIIPSWAMRADALTQYLIWKKWKKWFLVYGKSPIDLDYANAIKRSAQKYRAKVVEERSYKFEAGHRRIDSGHQQIQTQMPRLTQSAKNHDVVFVADAAEAFGEYLLFRTESPRPVVGSHGLIATAWHRSFEQYAGMQMQNRFEKFAKRIMTERDYTAWLAVKILGKTMIRIKSDKVSDIRSYIHGEKFNVAGFKGRGMTFRVWNRQLRQPIILTGAKALVSMSPQDGFLHPKFHMDTLGVDEPETKCPFVTQVK